jgi:hypothetical protein
MYFFQICFLLIFYYLKLKWASNPRLQKVNEHPKRKEITKKKLSKKALVRLRLGPEWDA